MSKARARRRQSHLLRLMAQHDGRLRAQAVDRKLRAQAHRPITDDRHACACLDVRSDRRVMACRHDISQGQKSLEQGLISLHFWRHNDQGGVASAKRARIASAACLPSCPKPQIPPCRHALWLFLSPDRQMKSGVLLTYLLASPVQVRPNTSATMWLQTEEEADGTLGCAPSWSFPSGNCSPSTLTRTRREMRPDSCASTTDSCAVTVRRWGGVR